MSRQGRDRDTSPTDLGSRPDGEVPNRRPDSGDGGDRDGATSDGHGWRPFVRDLLTSVLAVLVVGAYLFAVSGVWPPLVAVESESMVPHMQKSDLVFVMEENRFPGPDARFGVVTASAGNDSGYRKFQRPGDVVVFRPEGRNDTTPVIHRAMFWVEAGEDWYDRADPRFLGGADSCEALSTCPADHAGFITKGDANPSYDQVVRLPSCRRECDLVRPAWVVGTAEARIPGLGWLRLHF